MSGLELAKPRNVIKPVGQIIVLYMPQESEKVLSTIHAPFVELASKVNIDFALLMVEMLYA